jgi:hypothetical protein
MAPYLFCGFLRRFVIIENKVRAGDRLGIHRAVAWLAHDSAIRADSRRRDIFLDPGVFAGRNKLRPA